jgi:hypothetical protein
MIRLLWSLLSDRDGPCRGPVLSGCSIQSSQRLRLRGCQDPHRRATFRAAVTCAMRHPDVWRTTRPSATGSTLRSFSIPGNNIGCFGNAGGGTLAGPGTTAFSMSVGKSFSLTERVAFHYEAQFANLFNIENYSAPSMNLRSDFGKISALQSVEQGGPRTIQMTLRLFF